jgi:hypothetical protein
MNVQQLEYDAPLRIKFASMDKNGRLVGNAGPYHYDFLFSDDSTMLEGGWTVRRSDNIHTRQEPSQERNGHRTWILSKDKIQIAAVEHEDGIELLFDMVKDVTVQVGTAAVTSLITLMWSKWRKSRGSREDTYMKETLKILPNGTKVYTREELPNSVSSKGIEENVANALAELSKYKKD